MAHGLAAAGQAGVGRVLDILREEVERTMILAGVELLLGFILGVELECRIGRAISPGHYAKGWHITATCGVFGAAAATGKLLGLDDTRMVWALANAATQSSGLCECLGWPAKSIGVGNAARNGMWSALLADKGFEGPPEPIAGVQPSELVFAVQ